MKMIIISQMLDQSNSFSWFKIFTKYLPKKNRLRNVYFSNVNT